MFEHPLKLRAPTVAVTHEIASALAGLSRSGDVIVLAGEMGVGKTAFAQGFGLTFGVVEPITSPTFTVVHSYEVPDRRCTMHHVDLYRLERTGEVADLALMELAEDGGVLLVEWGDVVSQFLGDHLTVLLERDIDRSDHLGEAAAADTSEFGLDGIRLVSLSSSSRWVTRWAALAAAVEAFRC